MQIMDEMTLLLLEFVQITLKVYYVNKFNLICNHIVTILVATTKWPIITQFYNSYLLN